MNDVSKDKSLPQSPDEDKAALSAADNNPDSTPVGRKIKIYRENASKIISIGLILLFAAAILLMIARGAPVVDKISNPAFARGLITLVIALATIGLAFMMAYQAFYAEESSDERFRRAREIFTGLMGVLGTIVGFYFGSAGDSPASLAIAKLQFPEKTLVTYVTGGKPPYRVTFDAKGKYFDDKEIKVAKEILSDDGWFRYKFDKDVKTLSSDVCVKDSDNRTISVKGTFDKNKQDEN